MPVCAQAVQQSNGTYVIQLDPSNTNLSTCAYVLETGQESEIASLFSLAPQDAITITGAVAVCWGIAWGWRLIGKTIDDGASSGSD